jgi:DNA/RNA-binding domain of Phe-tRNA-synthetase-like protein
VYFQHASDIWRDFPELVPGVLFVDGINTDAVVDPLAERFSRVAGERLAAGPESELPEIQAWRRAFSRMGLKPTQYRCASEALLRRFRKEGELPRIHPLIDLCNAISLAFAIPVAVIDVSQVADFIEVRYASGTERYLAFSGEWEHPDAGEVIFADADGRAHARRWTNRQSALSAVRDTTTTALIVAEAMHAAASSDMVRLLDTLAGALREVWNITPASAILTPETSTFSFSSPGIEPDFHGC